MSRITLALRAARELGPAPLALYASYGLRLRSGWLRHLTPPHAGEDRPLTAWLRPGIPSDPLGYFAYRQERAPRFFFDDGYRPRIPVRAAAIANREAADIARGRMRLFGGLEVDLGRPPDWSAFVPVEGQAGGRVEPDRHWTEYSLEGLPQDIKLLWEPSRFGWVFRLARAYRHGRADRPATTFWTLVDSWRTANAPNLGLQWASAQEVALRLMALAFGMYAFDTALSPDQVQMLAVMIGEHASRIPPTLDYARAQNNNHLLSETAALLTAGVLFPEFKQADAWRRLGRHWFESALRQQVFDDGGYVQHSTNYHRLALQLGLWTARVAELGGQTLSQGSLRSLARLTRALSALVDPETGEAPNLGPNDGTLFLPLTDCPFEDYRPTIQAAAIQFLGQAAFPSGPWDELGTWLGVRQGQPSDQHLAHATSLPKTGLEILKSRRGRAFLRCAAFQSRPGHSDQLHLDLWRAGHAVARDAGTYLYAGKGAWDNGLSAATVHNTVVLDGADPMRRAGRFLWLDWPRADVLGRWSAASAIEVVAAEHDGYRRFGIRHRRTVARAGDDTWLVIDDLTGRGGHRATVGWLLPEGPHSLHGAELRLGLGKGRVAISFLADGAEIGLYRGGGLIDGASLEDAAETWGWYSPAYAVRDLGLRFAAQVGGPLPLRAVTVFAFDRVEESVAFALAEPGAATGLRWVEAAGQRLTW